MTTRKSEKISAKRFKEMQGRSEGEIDFSDIPELDESFFQSVKLLKSSPKKQITLRLDSDVLEYFRKQGKGYQKRMNDVLKAYVHTVAG